MLVFVEGGKPNKNPRSKEENQQQTQPTCDDRDLGIEPRLQRWEASALNACAKRSTCSFYSIALQIYTI